MKRTGTPLRGFNVCKRKTTNWMLLLSLCFLIITNVIVWSWSHFENGNTNKRVTSSRLANPMPTWFSTGQYKIVHHVSLKQFLEVEFNKTIEFAKIRLLKERAEKAGFSPSIVIPDHQMEKNYGRKIHSRKIPKTGKHLPPKRTCAIVGSSGILLGSRCGAEIDAHDFVMRSNLAPINEYQEDVGNKTNVMTINREATRTLLQCIRSKKMKYCDPKYRRFHEFKNAVLWFSKFDSMPTNDHLTIVNFFRKSNLNILVAYPFKALAPTITRFWNLTKKNPSSGLFMYSVSITLCDMISLYGFYPFGISPDGRNLTFHYDGKSRYGFNNGHNMTQEFRQLNDMSKEGYFRIVTDKCGHL